MRFHKARPAKVVGHAAEARRVWLRAPSGMTAVLAALLLVLLFSHPLVHGDGLAYFAYLDSIAGDGDLDLGNQAARFGSANLYQIFAHPATGELVTSFPFGSAFLLAPFHWMAQVFEPLAPPLQAQRDYFLARQGLPLAYSLAASLGALCYCVAAVWLAYRAARRIAPGWASAAAALSCLAGSPLLYYATVEPMATLAYGAFLLALA